MNRWSQILVLVILLGIVHSCKESPKPDLKSIHKPLRNLVITDPMLAYHQAREEIKQGKKEKNPIRMGLGNLISGNVKWILGELPEALDNYYQALEIFQKEEDLFGQITTYNDMALVFVDEKNFQESLQYLKEAHQLNESYEDEWLEVIIESNIGDVYLKNSELDSALYYTSNSYALAQKVDDPSLFPFILMNLARIDMERQEWISARQSLDEGMAITRQVSDQTHTPLLLMALGDLHTLAGSPDSAYHQYKSALRYAGRIDSKIEMYTSAKKLQQHHENQHRLDSAYRYSLLVQGLQDSLLGAEKVRMITQRQHLEQIRQQELMEEREREAEARKHLRQYLLIVLVVLCLIGLAFLLKNTAIKALWLETYLIIVLLFLFEFLTLLAHTFFGELTHHSPALTLMLLIIFAAVLSPIHHHSKKYGSRVLGIDRDVDTDDRMT